MIEIRANAANWNTRIELLILDTQPNGNTAVAAPLTMVVSNQDEWAPPTTAITKDAAQVLMDDLWRAGLRPSEGSGSAGSLRATEKHLNDLRKIVSKKLGVDL